MRIGFVIPLLFLSSCQNLHPRPSDGGGPPLPAARLSDLDVHARTSLFWEAKLPAIDVVPLRGQPTSRSSATQPSVRVTYYDQDYQPVTKADRAGRYGAIVLISAPSGQAQRRYLTLCRLPQPVDWDGVRMPIRVQLPSQFGISQTAADAQASELSEFFKTLLQESAERKSDAAAMAAGLMEYRPDGPFVARQGFLARDQRWWAGLKQKLGEPALPHLLFLPSGYEADPSRRWPLILFLHGSGEAGYGGPDLAKLQRNTLARMIATRKGLPPDFPFIVLMPQCPPDQYWSPYDLMTLLDEVRQNYRVDDDRVYLTGLSLGGYGVWDTAIAFPQRFAAIAPVCGAGDPGDVSRIRQLPTWVFHGQRDPTVPVYEAHRMVDALRAVGADPRLTIYTDAGHDAWTRTYHDPELYRWFLQHSRVDHGPR